MKQFRRARTLAGSTFRPPSPEPAPPDAPVTTVPVGKVDAVPSGGLASFSVEGRDVAVADVAGAYYAFSDICTHRKCSLSDGELDGGTLTCICHGSRFDVTTGEVVRGPADRPLQVYPARVQGDELEIDLPAGS